jgi:hypothetical protein
MDPVSLRTCKHDHREWLIRWIASLVNHFNRHDWDVRASFDGAWRYVHTNAACQQDWTDQLAKWTHQEVAGQATQDPFSTGLKTIAIATASRVESIFACGRSASNAHWIVLNESSGPTSSTLQWADDSAIEHDGLRDRTLEMQQRWNSQCGYEMQSWAS